MKRSHHRIATTHTGSLPRPADLLAMAASNAGGEALAERLRSAVGETIVWAKLKALSAGAEIASKKLWH